jgi:hypothetical protein
MANRDTRAGAAGGGGGARDEDLEEVVELALEEDTEPDAEIEVAIEEALAEEPETAEAVAATEAEPEARLGVEDRAAPGGEAGLEVLLRRTGVLPDETELGRADEEAELPAPRHAGEFACAGCFLVKPLVQLADGERRLCRDCADPAESVG